MTALLVASGDLSKALSNAEAWLPAKSSVPVALVRASAAELTFHVTDTYTAGVSRCPLVDASGPAAEVEISRADLVALAAAARKHGTRKVTMRLSVECGGVILHGPTEGVTEAPVTALSATPDGRLRSEWPVLEDMFAAALKDARPPGERLMVSPAYLALWNKVRPDKSGRGVDLLTVPVNGALFGKLGPNFQGMAMVIDAPRNEKELGQGGLW